MSITLDIKFATLLGPSCERFKRKSQFLWQMRCPICGDSAKSKTKARGYIYRKQNSLFFTCHNCSTSKSLKNFLKHVNHSLYEEYVLEEYQERGGPKTVKPKAEIVKPKEDIKLNLPLLSEYPDNFYANHYLRERKILKQYYSTWYYADNFQEFAQSYIRERSSEVDRLVNEPRIIIPFYDQNKVLQGFQGRALLKSKVRYITLKVNESAKKVFGLDTVDLKKKVYVVEGIIDSLFLNNSIAMLDAALYRCRAVVGDSEFVLVSDNECRNPQIVGNMKKAVEAGYSICVWPKEIQEKDINDMILAGRTGSEIQYIIDKHTYSGLIASMEISAWAKV